MGNAFPTLFSPYQLGTVTLRNRFVVTAHATSFEKGGLLDDNNVSYWVRKAEGGAGLVITNGAALVHAPMGVFEGRVSLWDPRNESHLTQIADGAHHYGTRILSQATHRGRAHGHKILGFSDTPMEAPSAVPQPNGEYPRVLKTAEIGGIVQSFVDSALRLQRCGMDGMEILSLGDHLMQQFWSLATNHRDDQYGGSFENRMRFTLDTLRAVREATGPDFLLGFRMAADPLDGHIGLTTEDLQTVAQRIDAENVISYFNVSAGTSRYDTVAPDTQPRSTFLHYAATFKKLVTAPVLYAGRILDVEDAERAVASGDVDLVAMTRMAIADPDLPKKAEAGQLDRIRPCIALVDACIGRTHQNVGGSDFPIRCGVNPSVGFPELEPREPAAQSKSVVVIGGGPAGLEAARVAALRGHRVTLFEAGSRLGGQVNIASQSPYRPHLRRQVTWMESELPILGVDVRTGTRFDLSLLEGVTPDAFIVATGSMSALPENINTDHLTCGTDIDVYANRISFKPGMHVAIWDREARIRGGTMATMALEAGSTVTLATSWRAAMDDLDAVQTPFYYRKLASGNADIRVFRDLRGTRPGEMVLWDEWAEREETVKADLALFIGYRSSENSVEQTLLDAGITAEIHVIGDSLAPRRYRNATRDGAVVAMGL